MPDSTRRRYLAVCASATMIGPLAGCSGDSGDSDDEDEEPQGGDEPSNGTDSSGDADSSASEDTPEAPPIDQTVSAADSFPAPAEGATGIELRWGTIDDKDDIGLLFSYPDAEINVEEGTGRNLIETTGINNEIAGEYIAPPLGGDTVQAVDVGYLTGAFVVDAASDLLSIGSLGNFSNPEAYWQPQSLPGTPKAASSYGSLDRSQRAVVYESGDGDMVELRSNFGGTEAEYTVPYGSATAICYGRPDSPIDVWVGSADGRVYGLDENGENTAQFRVEWGGIDAFGYTHHIKRRRPESYTEDYRAWALYDDTVYEFTPPEV